MTVVLMFLVCLAGAPDRCMTVLPDAPDDLTLIGCALAGMTLGAQWLDDNPGYEIARVRCVATTPGRGA